MNSTKKLAVSAMLAALGTALLAVGAFVEVADLSACALASVTVMLVYIELGSPYTWLVWITTSLTSALLFPGSLVWIEYLTVFGIWPIAKGYLEKLPKLFWIPIKLAYINIVVAILFFFSELVLGVPFFEEGHVIMKVGIVILINICFLAFDKLVEVLSRLYFLKYRDRFKRFFQ